MIRCYVPLSYFYNNGQLRMKRPTAERTVFIHEPSSQTRSMRSGRRSCRLLQAPEDDKTGRETRSQFGIHQRRGWHTPERRWTHPRTMGLVIPHSPQRQVTEARPEHHRRLWPMAREHVAKSSAHDAGADRRHPLIGEWKGDRTGRSLR